MFASIQQFIKVFPGAILHSLCRGLDWKRSVSVKLCRLHFEWQRKRFRSREEETGERTNGEGWWRCAVLNNLQGVMYPPVKHLYHTNTHGSRLSILFPAVGALMGVHTNYSARSGKRVVATAEEKPHGSQYYWSQPACLCMYVRSCLETKDVQTNGAHVKAGWICYLWNWREVKI